MIPSVTSKSLKIRYESKYFVKPVKSHFCIESDLISTTDEPELLTASVDVWVLLPRSCTVGAALLVKGNLT